MTENISCLSVWDDVLVRGAKIERNNIGRRNILFKTGARLVTDINLYKVNVRELDKFHFPLNQACISNATRSQGR